MPLTDNDSGLLLSCLILLTGSLSHRTTGAWRHSAARPNLARFYLRTSIAHMVILILTSSYLVFISEYYTQNRIPPNSRGSWFVVCNRIILSCCWYGVLGWYGGQLVKVLIGSIWRESTSGITNLPSSDSYLLSELLQHEKYVWSGCGNDNE